MPEYLAPGVFVEETSFRQKTIEGVSTSTSGFIGPTRFGPIRGEPPLLTSFSDFERIYGGIDPLEFQAGTLTHNYLAQAVRGYFDEGGRRLYVVRVNNGGGTARWSAGSPAGIELRARYAGEAGNVTVTLQFKLGPNVLFTDTSTGRKTLQGARNYDVVWVETGSPSAIAENVFWVDQSGGPDAVTLRRDDGLAGSAPASPSAAVDLADIWNVRILTVSVTVGKMGRFDEDKVWEDLSFHPRRRDSIVSVFEPEPAGSRTTSLYVPLVFAAANLDNGATIAEALLSQESMLRPGGSPPGDNSILAHLRSNTSADSSRIFQAALTGGSDGDRPTTTQYIGDTGDPSNPLAGKSGLAALEDIEDISIIAAPGSTHVDNGDLGDQVMRQLILHCEKMRYRVAVLDSQNSHTLSEVRAVRGTIDSTRAAFYYPWIRVFDPVSESEILVPPSGSVTGIFARNDVEHGVHKSPANEVVRQALGLEFLINKSQQEVLNPLGINCLRFFEGRGYRVWGARTASSDPEWKYVNVRRYFVFLERSIERGTQWVVFENNGPVLWENVRTTVEDFLFNEWKENHLLGTTPEQAYFVRCDRTTMTQNDLDNGRLICLIGVAPLRPAEFVIFRIGQKTADSRS